MSHACRPSRHRVAGFGLIELMIALVLGLLVIGAAFAVFQSNQNTYRANEGQNRIQESVRTAFEMMSRDLRAAGGGPCSNASQMATTDAERSLVYRDTPVTINSTTELTTISADDASYRLTAATTNSVTLDNRDISADQVSDVFRNEDWILLCNANWTAIVQLTNVSGSVLTYSPAFNPRGDAFATPTTASVARLRNTRWLTADNGRGGRSLYVARAGGAPEEVAENVQSLAITYLVDGASQYVTAPAANSTITAVRINLVLRGQDVDGAPLIRNASNVVSLRSHTQ
jgi:type IV pilus assembly protein PilW